MNSYSVYFTNYFIGSDVYKILRKKSKAFDAMKKPQAPDTMKKPQALDTMKNIHCENYLDFLKTGLKNLLGGSLDYILLALLVISAVVSFIDYIAKPDFIRNNHYLKRAFSFSRGASAAASCSAVMSR